jgi:hypothetical protein
MNFPSVPDLDQDEDQLIGLNGIDQAVISDSNPVEFINSAELLDPKEFTERVFSQEEECFNNPVLNLVRKSLKLLPGRLRKLDLITA